MVRKTTKKPPIRVVQHTLLTSDLRKEVIDNVTEWNRGKWSAGDFLNLPDGHWVLLEARSEHLPVGYFLLAFDTSEGRITLPIESVFSEQKQVFDRFKHSRRGEAVFTIVNPAWRRRGVFERLVANVFWHILSKGIEVILSETEGSTLELYRKMGLRIRKLSNVAKDYQGGPCFPSEIPFSLRYKLEGILSCLLYGTLREIRFFGRE